MSWPHFTLPRLGNRAVRRRSGADREPPARTATETRPGNHAMAGLDVQPVHGRHCICERCHRQDRAAS